MLFASGIRPPALGKYLNEHAMLTGRVLVDIERLGVPLEEIPTARPGEWMTGSFWLPHSGEPQPFHGQISDHVYISEAGEKLAYAVGFSLYIPTEITEENAVIFDEARTDASGLPRMTLQVARTPADEALTDQARSRQQQVADVLGDFDPERDGALLVIWDREAAIAPKGKPLDPVAAFAGTLATRMVIAPARDPEFKGMTERNNDYFERSFLPGRRFSSPGDFNTQIHEWITTTANHRHIRSIGASPAERIGEDLAAMTVLPPAPPSTGFSHQVRLGRDYYIRFDTNDYSVDPRFIGRLVQITATLERVVAVCDGQIAADHTRCWAKHQVITDPGHVATAKLLRAEYNHIRQAQAAPLREVEVSSRDLGVYDQLFGLTPTPAGEQQQDRRAA